MFSVLLELPEFEVVNQEIFSTHYLVHVEKKDQSERCPHCGFHSSCVHDKRTRKVRDLSVLNKPLFLSICVNRYRCQNCGEVFSASFESVASHQHYTQRFRLFIYEQVLGTTIQDISRKYQIAYSTVERIFYLDQVRKKIPGLKKSRFCLLKSYENLTEKQRIQLGELIELHENLAYGYYLKELFRDFYKSQDYETAEQSLKDWLQLAWSSPFTAFHEVAKTIENWHNQILQYFKTPFTNGRTEGTNHKIKNIKRRSMAIEIFTVLDCVYFWNVQERLIKKR